MERRKTPFLFVLLCCTLLPWPGIIKGQSPATHSANYFKWPVNITPEIVANLGELRPNHWHMGLDIRTKQRENLPVVASASGYIARIRIEKSGFGRSIFINHPNGTTTLYAHLNDFFPELEAYVTQQQYEKETWAVQLDFPKEKFPVAKGDFIAYSGTTGGSQGPHVHFEIRNTATGECLNPLFYGLPLTDNVRPSMLKLAMYDRSKSIYDQSTKFYILKNTDSGYIIPSQPVVRTGLNKISFAIQAFDRISGSRNEDGIYSAQLFFDDQPVVQFRLDSISYSETGYMNAHIDYKYLYNGGPFFQHIAQLPGDRSGVYHQQSGSGVIELADTMEHSVRIQISDAYQNSSHLNFRIRYDDALATERKPTQAGPVYIPNQVNILEKPGFELYLPEQSIYDTVQSYYLRNNSFAPNAVSAMHQVNDPSIPIQDELTVRIKPDKPIPPDANDKLIIRRTYRGRSTEKKATWNGQWMSAKFGDFGVYQAFVDLTPPVINSLGRGDTVNLSPASRIVFTPTDNFEVASFRAELNGKWLRFTNDKGRSHIYIFDERCPYGVHELKVTVTDLAGNVTTKTWWFKRYPYTPPPKKKITRKKSTSKKGVNKKRKPAVKRKTGKK